MRRSLPTCYWHTTPLHYAPFLLQTGVLYSQNQLRIRNLPVRPRPTVERRDRKLSLDGYVHLSLAPRTPLLTDKLQKGYPHILIALDRAIDTLPTAAYLKYNPKRWAHRDDFLPVTEPEARADFLDEWERGRYPSAELLIAGEVPLSLFARALYCATEAEAAWLTDLTAAFTLCPDPLLPMVQPDLFPPHTANFAWEPFERYAATCREAGKILPPPDLPFD